MKRTLLFTCIFLLAASIQAQNIYQDALLIKSWVVNYPNISPPAQERPEFLRIIKYYFPALAQSIKPGEDYPGAQQIQAALNSNEFLKDFIFPGFPRDEKITTVSESPLSSIGSLDVTNIAYGITDFLIDRTKVELNITFFNRFKEEMQDKRYSDLRSLFPETAKVLEAIGEQIYYYNNYLQTLRSAFHTDLRRLPYNIEAWLKDNRSTFIANSTISNDLYSLLCTAVHASTLIIENQHPGKILDEISGNLNNVTFDETNYKNLKAVLKLTSLVSESFRDKDQTENHYWVNAELYKKLKDIPTLKIYLGLLYQYINAVDNNKDATFDGGANPIKLSVILKNNAGRINNLQKFITGLTSEVENIQRNLSAFVEVSANIKKNLTMTGKERAKLMFNAYIDVFSALTNLIKRMPDNLNKFNATQLSNILTDEQIRKIKEVTEIIENAQKAAVYAVNSQYAGAISQVFLLLKNFKSEDKDKWQKLLTYGTFMSNLTEAESPEAVTSAIEAVAAPPGSYSIKRRVPFSIALNGYLGVFGGSELISVNKESKWAFSPAITAPIGISINYNSDDRWDCFPNIFVSVIDLGFIASFRFNGSADSVSTVPKVQLYQIVSPGIFLEWGTGESSPITIGLGYQMGPQIRENESDTQILGDIYHRFGLSVKVDIPILYFRK